MIQVQTLLNVADNSGAKKVMCIKVLGGTRRRYASVGDIIKVSIKSALPKGKVKKGEKSRALIVRTANRRRRVDGSWIKFDQTAVVLIDNKDELIGTRVLGPVDRELRAKGWVKVTSLASEAL